jgi:biopolymer transport protein ExbB/TolQ
MQQSIIFNKYIYLNLFLYHIMLYIDIICDNMKVTLIVEKIKLLNKKFITRIELKKYCNELNKNYYNSINYLIRNNYLIRILRGIFYVPSLEERKYNRVDSNFYDIITKTMEYKKS